MFAKPFYGLSAAVLAHRDAQWCCRTRRRRCSDTEHERRQQQPVIVLVCHHSHNHINININIDVVGRCASGERDAAADAAALSNAAAASQLRRGTTLFSVFGFCSIRESLSTT